MNSVQKLTKLFSDFPGIGPRQAKRFVYFLLTRDSTYLADLVELIQGLKREVSICSRCFRYYPKNNSGINTCPTCADPNKDKSKLLVLARDVDFEHIEKTGVYDGYYFILGGNVPILDKDPEKRIRLRELSSRIEKDPIEELIIAMNANPDGENTEDVVRAYLRPLTELKQITISTLGRGLSTGVELEYSDSQTLRNALEGRRKS